MQNLRPSILATLRLDRTLYHVNPEEIWICDLSNWPPPVSKDFTDIDRKPLFTTWVTVDPVLGRLAFPTDATPAKVAVSYAYGFAADLGGGPYDRRETLAIPKDANVWSKTVAKYTTADYTTLAKALAAWADGGKTDAVITILDNATYEESLLIEPVNDHKLVIQAANGKRPTLLLRVWDEKTLTEELGDVLIKGGAGKEATLTLNGLLIEGGIRVKPASLGQLQIRVVHK